MIKKGFLNNRIEKFELSRLKFSIGVLLGLLYAFFFYFFLKLIREFFRFFAASLHEYDLLVLPKHVTSFYNFFFAFIAILFAQSVVMVYWFDKPKEYLSKYNYKRASIINDHRYTNWFFLHWFAKIGFLFGLVAVDSYSFNIYPNYNYIFILTAIVLYLQVWNSFRYTFKDKGLKWMLYSLTILLISSFGLSKINLVNYKKINKSLLNSNITYKYRIYPPVSKVYNEYLHKNFVFDLYFTNHTDDSIPVLIIDRNIINKKNLQDKLHEFQDVFRFQELQYINYNLHINRDIKMEYVTDLKNRLSTYGAVRVSYAVRPFETNPIIPFYHDFNLAFPAHKIHINSSKTPRDNQIEIKLLENGNYLFNNTIIKPNKLISLLKETIKPNPNYSLKIHINEWMSFDDYFKIISSLGESIYKLRDEYSQKEYFMNYKQLKKNRYSHLRKYEKVNKKYSISIIDKVAMY